MAYVKQNWVNLPNQTTPLSAQRLNHLETQYEEAVASSKSYTDQAIDSIDGHLDPLFLSGTRALVTDQSGNPLLFKGNPDEITGQSLWSITKVINALTAHRFMQSGDLEELVVISSSDAAYTSSSYLNVGDIVSVRDLLYLSALPSDNYAPKAIARFIAEKYLSIPEWSTPEQTFLQEMNRWCFDHGLYQGGCITVYSKSRFSMSQIVSFMRQLQLTPDLRDIFSASSASVFIGGNDSRSITVNSTLNAGDGIVDWGDRGVAKSGSSGGYGNVAFRYTVEGVVRYCVIMGASGNRYTEAQKAVEAVERGLTYFEYSTPRNIRGVENDTSWLDITHLFEGVEKTTFPSSGIRLRRIGQRCFMSIKDIILPGVNERHYPGVLDTPYVGDTFSREPIVTSLNRENIIMLDITDKMAGVVRGSTQNSGVYLTVAHNTVSLDFYRVTPNETYIPMNFEETEGLQPAVNAIGSIHAFDRSESGAARFSITRGLFLPFADKDISGNISWVIRSGATGYVTLDNIGGVQFSGYREQNATVSAFLQWTLSNERDFPDPNQRPGLNVTTF